MGHRAKSSRSITVCLVEAHPLAANLVASVLQGSRMRCVWQGTEIPFESLARRSSLVIVVDAGSLRTPLSKFLHLARSRLKSGTRFLAFDRSRPDRDLLDLFSLGIHGFLSYERVKDDLARAIRCIAEGNVWMEGGRIAEPGACPGVRLQRVGVEEPSFLTSREKEVMRLVERRLSNKEVASALGIYERTVKFHLGHVFAKLGVHDRYSAAQLAKANGAIHANAAAAGKAMPADRTPKPSPPTGGRFH